MLRRISDLDERIDTGEVVEWQSPDGVRYRYERTGRRVGVEMPVGRWEWLAEGVSDKRSAKRIVFAAINEDEL